MPYLLKEYQNRWYLIGTTGGADDFKTFGIDRISELDVKKETFKLIPNINPNELFENTVGLNYSANKLEDVILSFTPYQGM